MQIGSMPMMPQGASPRDQVANTLNAQVEAGDITSEDQDAMMAALDAIHTERMEAGRPEPGGTPPSREEMQASFESMLSDQVEAGTLDQDQADHLAEMFEEGELGRPPKPGLGSGQGGAAQELLSAILSQLQSGSTYDGSGEQSGEVASLLADYTV
ncbi:hypothetical protein [Roseibium sp.]|uniref:hypothetical protein n=1 Tax=Roseibium sp. TaxID=1936156 RepID=UPI003BB03AB1